MIAIVSYTTLHKVNQILLDLFIMFCLDVRPAAISNEITQAFFIFFFIRGRQVGNFGNKTLGWMHKNSGIALVMKPSICDFCGHFCFMDRPEFPFCLFRLSLVHFLVRSCLKSVQFSHFKANFCGLLLNFLSFTKYAGGQFHHKNASWLDCISLGDNKAKKNAFLSMILLHCHRNYPTLMLRMRVIWLDSIKDVENGSSNVRLGEIFGERRCFLFHCRLHKKLH